MPPSLPNPHVAGRFWAITVAAAAVVIASVVWLAAPPKVLGDGWVELSALATCTSPTEVRLDETVNQTGGSLIVNCEAVIDLNGHTLSVADIQVREDLTIEDTAGGGRLNATTGFDNTPGIRVPDGASLQILGGSVFAFGGRNAPGIGGAPASASDPAEDAGSITIRGGQVEATGGATAAGIGGAAGGSGGTVRIEGGTVVASGGLNAPGVGSGACGSAGGTVYVGPTATLTAVATRFSTCDTPALRLGGAAPFLEVDGLLQLDWYINLGWTIDVPDLGPDAAVLVGPTGTITGPAVTPETGARFSGDGRIDNHGVIALESSLVEVEVTGNNFEMYFDPVSPPEYRTRIFAPSFTESYRTAPTLSPGGEWIVVGENRTWSESETLTHDLYVIDSNWRRVDVTPLDPITAGGSVEIEAVVRDLNGPLSPQPPLVYESTNSDDVIAVTTLTARQAGTRTIFVREPQTTSTGRVELTVDAGPMVDLVFTTSRDWAVVGQKLFFRASGVDAYGNPIAVPVDEVEVTSSAPGDAVAREFGGFNVEFGSVDPRQHVIVAAYGQFTKSVTITVVTAAETTTTTSTTSTSTTSTSTTSTTSTTVANNTTTSTSTTVANSTTTSTTDGGGTSTTSTTVGGGDTTTTSTTVAGGDTTTSTTVAGGDTTTTSSTVADGGTTTTTTDGGGASTTSTTVAGGDTTTTSSTIAGGGTTTTTTDGGGASTTSTTVAGGDTTTTSTTVGGGDTTTTSSTIAGGGTTTTTTDGGGASTTSTTVAGGDTTTSTTVVGGGMTTTTTTTDGGGDTTTTSAGGGDPTPTTTSPPTSGAAPIIPPSSTAAGTVAPRIPETGTRITSVLLPAALFLCLGAISTGVARRNRHQP